MIDYFSDRTQGLNPLQGSKEAFQIFQTKKHIHADSGLTFLEVLITMGVTLVAFLGVAQLQLNGTAYARDSYLRTLSIFLANDMMDRIRANKTGVSNGDYNTITATPGSITANVTCVTSACSATTAPTIATYDAYIWRTTVANSFKTGGATGTVTGCNAATVPACSGLTSQGTQFTIVVNWILPSITELTLPGAPNPTSCSAANGSVDETCYEIIFRPFPN